MFIMMLIIIVIIIAVLLLLLLLLLLCIESLQCFRASQIAYFVTRQNTKYTATYYNDVIIPVFQRRKSTDQQWKTTA